MKKLLTLLLTCIAINASAQKIPAGYTAATWKPIQDLVKLTHDSITNETAAVIKLKDQQITTLQDRSTKLEASVKKLTSDSMLRIWNYATKYIPLLRDSVTKLDQKSVAFDSRLQVLENISAGLDTVNIMLNAAGDITLNPAVLKPIFDKLQELADKVNGLKPNDQVAKIEDKLNALLKYLSLIPQ